MREEREKRAEKSDVNERENEKINEREIERR